MTQKGQRKLVSVEMAFGGLGPGFLAWVNESGPGIIVLAQPSELVF